MKRVSMAPCRAAVVLSSVLLAVGCSDNDTPAAPATPTVAPSHMQVRSVLPQNGPDAPTWDSLSKGWSTTYTVTGFRVTLPCDVTGVRAMLHTRNNGLLTPPNPSETVAEATFPVKFQMRQ